MPSVPITVDTTQDPVMVLRRAEAKFAESDPELRLVKDSARAVSLTAGVILTEYLAVDHLRPAALIVITGSGLTTPTW
jgi:hypothetical protein